MYESRKIIRKRKMPDVEPLDPDAPITRKRKVSDVEQLNPSITNAALDVAECILKSCNRLPVVMHAHSDVMYGERAEGKKKSMLAGHADVNESTGFGTMMRTRALVASSLICKLSDFLNIQDRVRGTALGIWSNDLIKRTGLWGRENPTERNLIREDSLLIRLLCAIKLNVKNMQFILASLKEDEKNGVGWPENREKFYRWASQQIETLESKVAILYTELFTSGNVFHPYFNPDGLFPTSSLVSPVDELAAWSINAEDPDIELKENYPALVAGIPAVANDGSALSTQPEVAEDLSPANESFRDYRARLKELVNPTDEEPPLKPNFS